MSDELDRAVNARIAAYRPEMLPPFSAIEARRRARGRRRMAAGTGALSVIALAGAGLVVPSLTGGGDRLTPGGFASGDSPVRFSLSYGAEETFDPVADQEAVDRCLSLPGTSDPFSNYGRTPIWYVTVAGADRIKAFKNCAEALPGVVVGTVPVEAPAQDAEQVYRVSSDRTAAPAAYTDAVEKCGALPGARIASVEKSYPATYDIRASGADADAVAACLAAAPGARVATSGGNTQAGETVAFEGTPYTVSDNGMALTVTVPVGGGCQVKGDASVAVLETDDAVTLRATVVRPSPPPPPSLPPGSRMGCPANMLIEQVTVELDDSLGGRRVVDGLNGDILQPSGPDSDGAFIERCVGSEKNARPAEDYLGKSQSELDAIADSTGAVIRVVGRDGRCLGRTKDLQGDRVNVLLVADRVIWAARF